MLPIKQAVKTLYYATSNNVCFCTVPGKTENTKVAFFRANAVSVHCQSFLDFFSLFDSMHVRQCAVFLKENKKASIR